MTSRTHEAMKILSVVLATAVATSIAAAQQPIDQTVPSAATGAVEIHNTSGDVHVIGWDRSEIHITGKLGEGTERLSVVADSGRTVIRVVIPRDARNVQGTDLEVRVPAGNDLTVRGVSTDVLVEGVTGVVDSRSVSGDVDISGSPSRVTAGSTSGDVTVQANTEQVWANSTSGDVRVSGAARQSVSAESVSGDVTVDATTLDVVARSTSGDLRLGGAGRRVTATTVSGNASIRAGRIQYGSFESVSGSLRFEGDLQGDAAFNAKSHSGDVELILPAEIAASFEVNSFSGGIDNAFGPAAQRTSRYAPGRDLRFSTGEGGPLINVRTFSGSVRLVKR